jgi:hypothetical protein
MTFPSISTFSVLFSMGLAGWSGRLEDESEDVGDEDGDASDEADMAGDTVSLALDLEELAAGGSPADGDQSERKSNNREEEDHGGV